MKKQKIYQLAINPLELIIEQKAQEIMNMPNKKGMALLKKMAKKIKSGQGKIIDIAVLAKIASLVSGSTNALKNKS